VKYEAEIESGGMAHILSFIKIGSDVQKLLGMDVHVDTQTRRGTRALDTTVGIELSPS
jgi:hypothetical protein